MHDSTVIILGACSPKEINHKATEAHAKQISAIAKQWLDIDYTAAESIELAQQALGRKCLLSKSIDPKKNEMSAQEINNKVSIECANQRNALAKIWLGSDDTAAESIGLAQKTSNKRNSFLELNNPKKGEIPETELNKNNQKPNPDLSPVSTANAW